MYITVGVQLPNRADLAAQFPAKEYGELAKEFVSRKIQELLSALQTHDPSSAFQHVYEERKCDAYNDPTKPLTFQQLGLLGKINNSWILHKKPVSKLDQIGKGGKVKHMTKKSKRKAHRKMDSTKTIATHSPPQPDTNNTSRDFLRLTLRLNTSLEESYVLSEARSLLTNDIRAYPKLCQELSTVSNTAIFMFHHTIDHVAVLKTFQECVRKQEVAMFKHNSAQCRWVRRNQDPNSGNITFEQAPLPPHTLRYNTPPQIRKPDRNKPAKPMIADDDIHLSKVYILEMADTSSVRLDPVIAQLNENHVFRQMFGHKIEFVGVGSKLPRPDDLNGRRRYECSVAFQRGYNAMYDSIQLPGIIDPNATIRTQLKDSTDRPQWRSTNIRRELTEFIVTWYNPHDQNIETVPLLASQVAPVLDPSNPHFGSTTVVFYGGSAMRQVAMANLSEAPLQSCMHF
jgi:hypothetical protein